MKTSKYARDQWTIVRNKLITGEDGGKPAAGTKRKDCKCSPTRWMNDLDADCFTAAASIPTPTPAAKKTKTTKANKAASRAAVGEGRRRGRQGQE